MLAHSKRMELRRIYRNPTWLILLVLLLCANILIYVVCQTDFGAISMSNYRQVHQEWERRLLQVPAQEGLELLEQAQSELLWKDADPSELLVISRWQSRLRHIDGYDRKLSEVQQQAAFMRKVSIYNDPDSFAYQNIEQTATDFKRMEGYSLTPGNDEVLTSVVSSKSAIICGLLLMLATVFLFFDDNRMRSFIYGLPNGRLRLGLSRLLILVLTAALAVIMFHGTTLLASMSLYGDSIDTGRLLQSLALFSDYTIPMRVGEFLALHAALQFCAYVLAGLLFWAVLMWSRDYRIGCAIIAVFTVAEYALYATLSANDALGWLAGANIFVICSPVQFFSRYLNYDFFGKAVGTFRLACVTCIFWMLVSGTLCLVGQARLRPTAAKVLHFPRRKRKPHMSEWRKFWAYGKVALILLLYAAIVFTQFSLPNQSLPPAEAIYQDYAATHRGKVSQDTLSQIQLAADAAQEELSQLQREAPSLLLQEKLSYAAAKVTAFEKLQSNVSWMLQYDHTWLLDTGAYEAMFGASSADYRRAMNALTLFALILLVVPLYGCEHQCRTQSYLQTLPDGRARLAAKKLCIALAVATLLWLIQGAAQFYRINQKYGGFAGLCASGRSLIFWNNAMRTWPIWVQLFVYLVCQLGALWSAAGVILWISAAISNVRLALCASVAVFAVPVALNWQACHLAALSATGLIPNFGVCAILLVIGIAAAYMSARIWGRKPA